MRIFIAIDISEELREKIADIERKLHSNEFDVKFIEPKNLHITLKFLGDVKEEQINEICNVLEQVSKNFKKFKLFINGLGYFGSPKYIRVIWLGVENGESEIVSLIKILDEKLMHIRRNEFSRPSPHLTIGRVKTGRNREKLLQKINEFKDVKIGEMIVNEIKLKESVLTKKGPIYTDLKCFKLM
jgi:2'-5' RNA ligase